MTTINPPMISGNLFPTLRQIVQRMDTSVQKLAIVCATVVMVSIVGGLTTVAVITRGEVGTFGTAMASIATGVVTAVGTAKFMQRKGNGNGV